MKEEHVLCLVKWKKYWNIVNIRIKLSNWMGLFHSQLWSCLFCPFTSFVI